MAEAAGRRPDPGSLAESDLVALMRRGDPAAFATAIRRYNRRLFRVARGVVQDDGEAEDIVQETYVRAFINIARYRSEASLATWLTRIALNEAFDRVRRRRPTVAIDAPAAHDAARVPLALVESDADPETSVARAEIRMLVAEAIDGLPDIFRLVFVMRDVEDMTVAETAAHLGLRPETVKTRLHRARRLLRGRLEDRLATALLDPFPFDGERCDRLTEAVLVRLAAKDGAGKG